MAIFTNHAKLQIFSLTKSIIVEYSDVIRIFLQLFSGDRRGRHQVHVIWRLDRQGHGRPLHDTVPSKHRQIRQVHGGGHVCQCTIQRRGQIKDAYVLFFAAANCKKSDKAGLQYSEQLFGWYSRMVFRIAWNLRELCFFARKALQTVFFHYTPKEKVITCNGYWFVVLLLRHMYGSLLYNFENEESCTSVKWSLLIAI